MANHKSALKRHKQSEVRAARTRAAKTRIRNVVKDVRAAIKANDPEKAQQLLSVAASTMGKAASKGVLHKNNAANKKAKLAKKLAALSA